MRSLLLLLLVIPVFGSAPGDVDAGRGRFNIRCAGCHGQDGLGGERAPAIGHGFRSRMETESAIRDLIVHGIPDVGMPAFTVPPAELDQLVAFLQSRVLPLTRTALTGDVTAGQTLFFGKAKCAECHMAWGRGSVNGPDLTEAAKKLTLAEVETSLRNPDTRRVAGYAVASVLLNKGGQLRGFIRNESGADMQLQGLDGRLHLLSKIEIASIQRDAHSFMPPWTGSDAEKRDLIAFLSHIPDWKPGST